MKKVAGWIDADCQKPGWLVLFEGDYRSVVDRKRLINESYNYSEKHLNLTEILYVHQSK